MPVECPLPFGEIMECESCRYQLSDKCWWFFPARNILDILTDSERLLKLERSIIETHTQGPKWTNRQWDEVQQLKSMVLHFQKKINEMRANANKKGTKDIYIYKSIKEDSDISDNCEVEQA